MLHFSAIMTSIAIEVEYVHFDGSRKTKVLKSQRSNETITNLVRNVKKKFQMEEERELVPKLKLTVVQTEIPGMLQKRS